ncbi:HAD-IA family hydrolase [Streptomyces sp. MS19]|uniref:HAD-IA family hydrolase n=1 Tax=Streptomyces sp. MS19 TaxID=3385972 RepID=UPI0039A05F8F
MTARPHDAVICDLDGVLRHWPDAGPVERRHGLPAGALAAAAFAEARLLPAITGRVTDEEWRAAVADDLAARHGPAARAAVAEWSALVPTTDEEVAALLRAARAVVPVALLSNATTRLESDLAATLPPGLADEVVNTARIGVAKPDPAAFLAAADRLGVPPRRCLFADDSAANVAAARRTGMTAVHVRAPRDLRRALAPLLGGTPLHAIG